jgi:pantoate--beta-alanine ligase
MSVVLNSVHELRHALADAHARAEVIGFVPTMGALHEGHAALLRRAAGECPVTVLSIFVNPTQFGPNEDFSRYPRTFEADLALARECGITYVFAPTPEEIYPKGWKTYIEVEGVTASLCGAYRPGHFRGVATVVHRLFQLVRPQVAYFGQKDLQQCLVIHQMAKDLELPVKIAICPTVREADGLAMSSRNRYLSSEERAKSTVIHRAMQAAKRSFDGGERNVEALLGKAREVLATVPEFAVQYAEILSVPALEPLAEINGPAAFAVAGFLGKTRLIDNLLFDGEL